MRTTVDLSKTRRSAPNAAHLSFDPHRTPSSLRQPVRARPQRTQVRVSPRSPAIRPISEQRKKSLTKHEPASLIQLLSTDFPIRFVDKTESRIGRFNREAITGS
jgi:hypothetical protein